MNDEIKEILDRIEATFETTENNSFVKFKWLDYKQLLDYITNLQQENIKLISENEAVKNIKYIVDEVIYKSRIDKAIEKIEKYKKDEGLTMYHDTWQHLYPIYFILKGDDENENT